jgi:hypothetical protein
MFHIAVGLAWFKFSVFACANRNIWGLFAWQKGSPQKNAGIVLSNPETPAEFQLTWPRN